MVFTNKPKKFPCGSRYEIAYFFILIPEGNVNKEKDND